MMFLERALAVMEDAAYTAGEMLAAAQPEVKRVPGPEQKDFLTDADLRAEAIILAKLAAEYPEIPTLSEEKGGDTRSDGYLWIIDPLDGTVNFFLQDDHWGVSIGLAKDGRTVAGVIVLPAKKQIFRAQHGMPAMLSLQYATKSPQTELRVSSEENIAEAQFWIEWGKKETHGGESHKRVYDIIRKLDQNTFYPQIRNSCTATIMMVALGKIAGHVAAKPEPFDTAAAGLIVECAGGKVTDLSGNEWSPFSPSLVSTNHALHSPLMAILRSNK